MTYDNSNRGALFANERKTKPNQPDFTGNVVLSQELILHVTREIAAGREPKIAVSGWRKTSNAGKQFISLSVDKPYDPNAGQQAQRQRATPAPAPSGGDFDPSDDIPF